MFDSRIVLIFEEVSIYNENGAKPCKYWLFSMSKSLIIQKKI